MINGYSHSFSHPGAPQTVEWEDCLDPSEEKGRRADREVEKYYKKNKKRRAEKKYKGGEKIYNKNREKI